MSPWSVIRWEQLLQSWTRFVWCEIRFPNIFLIFTKLKQKLITSVEYSQFHISLFLAWLTRRLYKLSVGIQEEVHNTSTPLMVFRSGKVWFAQECWLRKLPCLMFLYFSTRIVRWRMRWWTFFHWKRTEKTLQVWPASDYLCRCLVRFPSPQWKWVREPD